MAEYRIVTDNYAGFEVQRRFWWFPVWLQVGINTHQSQEAAEDWIRTRKKARRPRRVVKHLGVLS